MGRKFKIGDVVRNEALGHEGQIVRIAEIARTKKSDAAYVVEVTLDRVWSMSSIEVLWSEEEIKKVAADSVRS